MAIDTQKQSGKPARAAAQNVANINSSDISKQHLSTASAPLPTVMWDWEVAGDSLFVSHPGPGLIGLPPMEANITLKEFTALVHPSDRDRLLASIDTGDDTLRCAYRIRKHSGGWQPVFTIALVVQRDAQGKPKRVVGSTSAIQVAPAAREETKPSVSIAQRLLELSNDWCWETDARFCFDRVEVSPEASLPVSREDLLGKPVWAVPAFSVTADALAKLRQTLAKREPFEGLALTCAAGTPEEVRFVLSGRPAVTRDGDFRGYYGIARRAPSVPHVEVRREQPPVDKVDAHHRVLSTRINKDIKTAQQEAKHLALVLVSIERVNAIEASLGSKVADALVIEAGQRIAKCVRDNDVMARVGRNEFLIALPALVRAEDATRALVAITRAFGQPFSLQDRSLNASCNVGISAFPQDGDDFELLFKRARLAMFHAKESGRNRYRFFASTLDQRAVERMDFESDLHLALQRKEFSLAYQPRISLATGNVTSVEALLRWKRAGKANISPAAFIPVAEDLGLMESIGEWVLAHACQQLRSWQRAGFGELRVSVNVSASQLRDRQRFLDHTLGLLTKFGLKGSSLELELREATLVTEREELLAVLQDLQDAGVRVAIDDFGTGQSSLSQLRNLPVQVLKLDPSFVADISNSKRDVSIVRAVIEMAHALELEVVAEGIESEAQVEVLRELGCDEIQGYVFSNALPATQLSKKLAAVE